MKSMSSTFFLDPESKGIGQRTYVNLYLFVWCMYIYIYIVDIDILCNMCNFVM